MALIPPTTRAVTFPTQTIYAPAAAQLAQGEALQALGGPHHPESFLTRQPHRSGQQLTGQVIHVDHYGNLVTNITQQLFEQHCGHGCFEVILAREVLDQLHKYYTDVAPGDCVAVFNSLGLLEIAINQGNAAALLGLEYDSPVRIVAHEKSY